MHGKDACYHASVRRQDNRKSLRTANGSKGFFCAHSACKVEAVDTTAAGDTFTGYFLPVTLRHGEADTALHTAAVAAGIAVSRKGAEPAISMTDEGKRVPA